ncbi:MAG: ABC transporter permease [Candidatus Marinimicrobia bacterium]|nr:ABC transporter permease [Candidatus Neomarinimicrobiota bacterium]RKY60686.1 MAG: ABC transporter permease [Candidatus Neomarinimicrobiota bacterium]
MNKVLLSIVKKEFIHIWRDPQTLFIVIMFPILMLFLYGYAITMEMKQIDTIIIDHSKSPQSRVYIEKIIAIDFFKVRFEDLPESKIEDVFFQREARCVIVFPSDFADQLVKNTNTPIQLLIDASDPNAANFIINYLSKINLAFNRENNISYAGPFSIEPRILYNPDFKSAYFFVPGLVAVIMLLISALLTSIAIVREKENGSLEQILVSPVRPIQIIIGKVIPYVFLGLFDSVLVLVVACFWFGVPINGSILWLGVSLLIYVLTGMCFGLLISTITNTQQVAMMATLVITILPSFLLSGFIFPVRSMPVIFQWFSKIIPATHFLVVIRGIMLKGIGLNELWPQLLILTGFSLFLMIVSMKKFSTKLE